MSENDNKKNTPSQEKTELAKRIANQSKRVSRSYETVEATIFRFIRFFSSIIDRIFFSRRYTGVVSLLLALLLYFSVNYSGDNASSQRLSNAKVLSGVSVNVRYNDESFEISGVPTTCQIVLTGEAANVNNAAAKNGYCLIDLEGYTEGTHSIPLVATGYGNNVTATVTPSEAMVTLKRKTTGQFALEYDFINKNQMDSRYILGTPTFAGDTTYVNIRASQDTLNSIAMVKALIDVSGQTADFEVNAPLVAYNSSGQVVNAEIDPSSVRASVTVTSPHKTVPILLNLNGEVQSGMAIDSVQMDHQTTVIYAPESVLAGISNVYVNLDASQLLSDSQIVAPVTLPSGVTSSEVNSVNLDVRLNVVESKTIENIPINYRNNNNSYGASEVDTTVVTATITGTASNIEKVTAEDISVYIDVNELEPGTYDLPLQVEFNSNMFVKCSLDRTTIHITLVVNE